MTLTASPGRGFACLSPERRCEIASIGGRAAHQRGTGHKFTSDEGRAAGSKGRAAVSADRDYMARIGRLGGQRRCNREPQIDSATVG